ncbi:MAG TPA: hypothetical protein VKI17_13470 [Gemmataceae bacterium]|nr:hypothetical protein [Gemmataceae bacterium]
MLTSFLVTCPHAGCHWFGSLLPHDHLEAWSNASPGRVIVAFRCPECGGEWHARVVGDDVVPVPLDEAVPKGT